MLSRTDYVLWELGRQEKIEPSYSRERYKFPPFKLIVPEPDLSRLEGSLRQRGRVRPVPVLSPELVVLHPAHGELAEKLTKGLNERAFSERQAYPNVVAVTNTLTPSIDNFSLPIPCIGFRGNGSVEEVTMMGNALLEASADIFASLGLAAPLDGLPPSLMPLSERPGRPVAA